MRKLFYIPLTMILIGFASCTVDDGGYKDYFLISGMIPVHAVPGDTLEVIGSGFGLESESIVMALNDQDLDIIHISDTSISVKIPEYVNFNSYDLSIRRGSQSYNREYQIKDYHAPRISGIIPFGASAGDIITISGQYFPTEESKVYCFFVDYNSNPIELLEVEEFIQLKHDSIVLKIPETMPSKIQDELFGDAVFFSFDSLGIEQDQFSLHTTFR
ncbi:IPT/TIG domain-containing protein [Algoriphagus sp.]|uniref:IPT/TIG domain-containing protein n=1 Tax=Algoriphagus sp. TaxID=1872435 RepID=UPI003F7060ED